MRNGWDDWKDAGIFALFILFMISMWGTAAFAAGFLIHAGWDMLP
jgi:hypothetical protein